MELEILKNVWTEYDKKLSENLKINNKIIWEINLNKAKSSMDIPKKYEIANVIFGFAFVLFVISYSAKYSFDLRLLASGILTAIWAIISLVFSISLLNLISKIDYYNDSILKIQNHLAKYYKRYFFTKKLMSFSGPIFVIISTPIFSKIIAGVDIFQFPLVYLIAVSLALIVGAPVAVWINKNWYEKKMNDSNRFLEELNSFENE